MVFRDIFQEAGCSDEKAVLAAFPIRQPSSGADILFESTLSIITTVTTNHAF
jgi:hypothetical protein